MADLAQRTRRAGRSPRNCTVVPSHRTCSSPATHASRNRLEVITRRASPVSGSRLMVMAVRELSCTRPAAAGANGVGRVEFMAAMVARHPAAVHVQISENRT